MMKDSLILVMLVILTGCQTKPLPEGFPKLYPVSVTITQESKPFEGAKVVLFSADNSVHWIVSGQTGSNGVAKLVTRGEHKGTPVGEFKVCVTKIYDEPVDPEPTNPGDWKIWSENLRNHPPKSFSLVEKEFGDIQTTPLSVRISADGEKNFTFDVGQAIREQIR